MPSIKDLKKRIGSVKNTQQTTKAMKMVSASKLRRAQEAIHAHRPYAQRMGHLIRLVSALPGSAAEVPLLSRREQGSGENGKKKLMLVLITSDRGLCGGFNSTVIKTAQRWLAENAANYAEVQLGFVGRKAYEFFRSRNMTMGPYFQDESGKVTFAKAKKVCDRLVDAFLSHEVDEVKFIYNEFKNAVSQKVVVEDFLPLSEEIGEAGHYAKMDASMYLVKPSREELLEVLLAKNFSVQAYRIMLESQASEHGARMSAMENATKNAGEMIRKLTLQYNKQRQAGITKELLEIIAGAESQKSAS